MESKIDKLIEGLKILRNKAVEISFYNASAGQMRVDTKTEISLTDATRLKSLGWQLYDNAPKAAFFTEGSL